MTAPIIVVFQPHSLRLHDNPALYHAARAGAPVVPLFVLDDAAAGDSALGAAARWWLSQSLPRLSASLRHMGSDLVIRSGDLTDQVMAVADTVGAGALHVPRAYDPAGRRGEDALHDAAQARGLAVRRFGGHVLVEPEAVRTQKGDPYTVFSPFWRACRTLDAPGAPLPVPETLPAPDRWPDSHPMARLDLDPKPVDWAGGLRESWNPGEAGAADRLRAFLDGPILTYKADRNRPDLDGTSGLSPHLRFGEISPRQLWHAACGSADWAVVEPFLRELGWRDFSYHLLYHFPGLKHEPLKPVWRQFPWHEGVGDRLKAWQAGRTGYPLVDAGMRQLWHQGWMHNRVRMVVASFLVKELLWHWRDGERWFWDTLVDADPGSNSASWQWVAGCGADAAPYFRIFNPVLQGEKFDPHGAYVRRWCPELADLPNAYVHKPFEAPKKVLETAGVRLGRDYPAPMVDRKTARARALEAFEAVKAP
ncbi:cryptochrome/photolyase family protein [Yunchengibacter salinarum]|uniref:cryptochrome/photolyase family protein n=1 Tax=Yunchengibacter salinarum TaxID=3133399 RepID=UPI0035B629D1